MIEGIDVAFIHSTHPHLADWYADILGLERGYSDGHWTEFRTQGVTRFAVEHIHPTNVPVEQQTIMLSFRVKDIQQAVQILAERGVQFYPSRDTTIFEAGPSLVATFQDPSGNWLQLSQRINSAD